jgi:hypothetical protein
VTAAACFLAPSSLLFLLVRLCGGAIFGLGHATSKRPRRRDANYQSLGARNGDKPPAVAGVEKSAILSDYANRAKRATETNDKLDAIAQAIAELADFVDDVDNKIDRIDRKLR